MNTNRLIMAGLVLIVRGPARAEPKPSFTSPNLNATNSITLRGTTIYTWNGLVTTTGGLVTNASGQLAGNLVVTGAVSAAGVTATNVTVQGGNITLSGTSIDEWGDLSALIGAAVTNAAGGLTLAGDLDMGGHIITNCATMVDTNRNGVIGDGAMALAGGCAYNGVAGCSAMHGATNCNYNGASGHSVLYAAEGCDYNGASGYGAMYAANGCEYNGASGWYAMFGATNCDDNGVSGAYAMYGAIGCHYNGALAGYAMHTASNCMRNGASGYYALYGARNCDDNGVSGASAMRGAIDCDRNGAIGYYALYSATNATYSGALGAWAGKNATGAARIYVDSFASDPGPAYNPTNSAVYVDNGTTYIGRPDGTLYLRGTVSSGLTNGLLRDDGTVAMSAPFNGGGQRFTNAAAPLAAADLTTRQYVDNKVSAQGTFYFLGSTASSDLAGQKRLSPLATASNLVTLTYSGVTNNQYLSMFTSEPGIPGITEIQAGVYHVTFWAAKGAAGAATLRAEAYLLDSAGTVKFEVEDTASTPALTTTATRYDNLAITLITNITCLATDRWSIRIKATVSSGTPTIYVYTEGAREGYLQGSVGTSEEQDPVWVAASSTVARVSSTVTNGHVVLGGGGVLLRDGGAIGTAAARTVGHALTNLRPVQAPITITYTGTNVATDASLGTRFRVTVTNNCRLAMPTNTVDGEVYSWWIKQGTGTNRVFYAAADWVLPVGANYMTNSTAINAVDVFGAQYDSVVGKMRVTTFMRYSQ